MSQVQEFIHCSGGPSSFYGFCEQTLHSLLLKVLPVDFKPVQIDECELAVQYSSVDAQQKQQIFILQMVTKALKLNFQFSYQQVCGKTFVEVMNFEVQLSFFFSVLQKNWSVMQRICSN